jgi:hypothetical protein
MIVNRSNFFDRCELVPESGCWIWMRGRANGYGKLRRDDSSMIYAHRISWALYHGPIPAGIFVLHRCDVRCCVNPAHLFLGTAADNLADMDKKGRRVTPRGEIHCRSKLTAADVISIRSDSRAGRELAEIYGVTEGTINRVKRRSHWRHV